MKDSLKKRILKLYSYFEEEKQNGGPLVPVQKVMIRTSAAFDVSYKSVCRMVNEDKKLGESGKAPYKIRRCRQSKLSAIDASEIEAIREVVNYFYLKKDRVNKDKFTSELVKRKLFSGSKSTLTRKLSNVGFCWKIFKGGNSILLEREYARAGRGRFLREITQVPFEDIIWVGDACVINQLSAQGKRQRILLLHAGGVEGFVNGAPLLFEKEIESHDYKTEINPKIFEDWVSSLLIPKLKPKRIIVMEKSPYRIAPLDRHPTIFWPREDICKWLDSKNMNYEHYMTKEELLSIVPKNWSLKIDKIFEENGHRVIWIPPNHGHFNAIEKVWSILNISEKDKNVKITLPDVISSVANKLNSIDAEGWKNTVYDLQKKISEQFTIYTQVEKHLEEMFTTMLQQNSEEVEFMGYDDADEDVDCYAMPRS